MSHVLTDLAADSYKAADKLGREIVGFVPSCTINSGIEGAAVGQVIRSHFTRPATVVDMAPAMTLPEGTNQTVDNKTMTLTKQRGVQIPWTGEDVRFVQGGAGYETIYGDMIQQAMRAIVNEIEADLAAEAYTNASRAVGVAGTTPFASDFALIAEARQILVDNGMPMDGQVSLVLNTLAGTNLRNLAPLQKANEAGGDQLLRNGVLLDLQGVMLKESAQVQAHTKGTGSGYLVNSASLAVGDTVIPADTGTGTIIAGDVVTFAGDANKYVVTEALSGGSFTIGGPGLRTAVADNAAITVGDNFTGNVVMHRSAMELAMRPFAKPLGGDAAEDVLVVQDPFSGLTFEISAYKGFNKSMIHVGAVWGWKAWKSDAIATVLG